MNKEYKRDNLTFTFKGDMTEEEWVADRDNGLGGSDMGSILNVNPYCSCTQLFYQKIGMVAAEDLSNNEKVHWGNELESIVRDNAQYAEGKDKDKLYVSNKRTGRKIRSIIEPRFIFTHSDYPFLRANVDGLTFDKIDITNTYWEDNLIKGHIIYPQQIAEIKTIGSMTINKWGGMPPYYILQVHLYMLMFIDKVSDLSSVIYSLKDGSELEQYPIAFSEDLGEMMVRDAYEFWQKVQKGREIMQDTSLSEVDRRKHLFLIEPTPKKMDEKYSKFISVNFVRKLEGQAVGTTQIEKVAKAYLKNKEKKKSLDDMIWEQRCKMENYMRKKEAKIIECEGVKIQQSKRGFTVNEK